MVAITPAYRNSLQLGIPLEVHPTAALLNQHRLVIVHKTESYFGAYRQRRSIDRARTYLEQRNGALMPVIVLRMKERYSCRIRPYDVAVGVENFLSCVSALGVGSAVDHTGRNLTTTANLQWAIADIDMGGRKTQHLPPMLVLDLKMRDLLDNIRIAWGDRKSTRL